MVSVYQVCVLEFVLKRVDLLYLKIYFLVHLLDTHLGCGDKKSSRECFGEQVYTQSTSHLDLTLMKSTSSCQEHDTRQHHSSKSIFLSEHCGYFEGD